ncbi:MAG: hypothetical protein M1837_003950 [Sclerophora amabilis]|nr:MAG: hypothetical protein M1837_003950 [Sclerophora amabilis]
MKASLWISFALAATVSYAVPQPKFLHSVGPQSQTTKPEALQERQTVVGNRGFLFSDWRKAEFYVSEAQQKEVHRLVKYMDRRLCTKDYVEENHDKPVEAEFPVPAVGPEDVGMVIRLTVASPEVPASRPLRRVMRLLLQTALHGNRKELILGYGGEDLYVLTLLNSDLEYAAELRIGTEVVVGDVRTPRPPEIAREDKVRHGQKRDADADADAESDSKGIVEEVALDEAESNECEPW